MGDAGSWRDESTVKPGELDNFRALTKEMTDIWACSSSSPEPSPPIARRRPGRHVEPSNRAQILPAFAESTGHRSPHPPGVARIPSSSLRCWSCCRRRRSSSTRAWITDVLSCVPRAPGATLLIARQHRGPLARAGAALLANNAEVTPCGSIGSSLPVMPRPRSCS
jgi:hypothetical protein